MESFNIPVVLFIFKRKNKSLEVLERIALARPKKLYLMADTGRDTKEKKLADECRKAVENAIDWPCNVIRDYAQENRGVYGNIAEGALRVFEKEDTAIFLEDDNLPELSFFQFCEQMLLKYKDAQDVLWICGTNYLGDYQTDDNEDYKFTQHLLPCGWASWKDKFKMFYDGSYEYLKRPNAFKKLRCSFEDKRLYKHYKSRWKSELKRLNRGLTPISWDYQMCLSLRRHDLLGVVPVKNQIRNIGVDEFSIHGGTSYDNVMTKRFCGMDSYRLSFPLTSPSIVNKDPKLEKKLKKIILPPFSLRLRTYLAAWIKIIFNMHDEDSLKEKVKGIFNGNE